MMSSRETDSENEMCNIGSTNEDYVHQEIIQTVDKKELVGEKKKEFIVSLLFCAGYCIITYLLGVGDRHLENIILLSSGHFSFHIDFDFIFKKDTKPLPPPFRLTLEMFNRMEGVNSSEYQQFYNLCYEAFNILRKVLIYFLIYFI